MRLSRSRFCINRSSQGIAPANQKRGWSVHGTMCIWQLDAIERAHSDRTREAGQYRTPALTSRRG
jgi:hypothetical protein